MFADFHVAGLIPVVPVAVVTWWLLMVPAWSYVATPLYRASGLFKYHSAFLRSTPGAEPKSVSLHLGTLYDLLWRVRPRKRRGEALASTVRREIFLGLLRLCERIEAGEIPPEASITACTYYLSTEQMSRLGFARDKGSSEARITELLGFVAFSGAYLDLMATRTVVLGRVRWFNPFQLAFYRTTALRLVQNAAYFRRQARVSEHARSG